MIICIIGGIGSGKTVTAVKEIIKHDNFSYTNFPMKNFKNYHRIKLDDVIIRGEKKKDWRVNWDFWQKARKKHKNISIYLDEIHNVIHARRSMSSLNLLMSKWVSQIRKLTSDSETNHLYIISQTLRKIDVDFRDLAQVFIVCRKAQFNKRVLIVNRYYESIEAIEERLRPKLVTRFWADKFFRYYDTLDFVTFGDVEEYI